MLSFVIPAYNEERFVGKCIESILAELQRNPVEAEIIVVNNASTDNTKSVALHYPGVKVVDEPRKGLSQARHTGFLASKGDLIANIDADNILPPGWIAKVIREFAKCPKLVALSGPFVFRDVPKWKQATSTFFFVLAFAFYLINRFVLHMGSLLQGGNFVIRRGALELVGGYNTNLTFYGEDVDIARRLNRVGKVKFTFHLPIYSSGRRLAGEGIIKTGIRGAINYIWITLFKRPFNKTSADIRPEK